MTWNGRARTRDARAQLDRVAEIHRKWPMLLPQYRHYHPIHDHGTLTENTPVTKWHEQLKARRTAHVELWIRHRYSL